MVVSSLLCRVAALAALGAEPAMPGSAAAEPARPQYHLIDMVVAQVDATVITLSELVAETRLVLLETGGPEVARAGHLSQSLLNTVLRSIVSRELLLGEVRRLKLRDVPEQQVKKALEDLRQRFSSPADYQHFLERTGLFEPGAEPMQGFDAPPGLVAIVLAELEVERFLEVRVRRNVVVRESDIALCFEESRHRFGERTLDEVRGLIRERIEEQRRTRALEALLQQLERRATVRYTPGFESQPPQAEESGIGLDCPEPSRVGEGSRALGERTWSSETNHGPQR